MIMLPPEIQPRSEPVVIAFPVRSSPVREAVLWTEDSDFHLERCRQEMEAADAASDPMVRHIHIRLGMMHAQMISPDQTERPDQSD